MKVTKQDSVFTTNVHHAKISGLGTDSTKRLRSHCASEFGSTKQTKGSGRFDDRVKDVLLQYALRPDEIEDNLRYLDSIGYNQDVGLTDGQMIEQVLRFQAPHAPSFRWNRNYQKAVEEVKRMTIPLGDKLKPLKYRCDEDFKNALPKADAHSGFEYFVTGLKFKKEYLDGAFDHFTLELTIALRNGTFGKPIVVLHRVQCKGAWNRERRRTFTYKMKKRLVSAIDIWQVFAEIMFAKPFQRHLGCLTYYAAGKPQHELRTNVQHFRHRYNFWTSIDYSSYDQSIPRWLIEDAFGIIHDCFDMNDDFEAIWDIIVKDFCEKGFVGPNGTLMYAQDGVPSGSMFTQIIDTICNLIMIRTYLNAKEEKYGSKDAVCIICGDDNLIFSNFEFDFADLEGYLQRCFGVRCNAGKCESGTQADDPEFLSRTWRVDGEWRAPEEVLAKLVYPERFRPYDRNPDLTPDMIVYSYILAFPLGMKELIDVETFMKEHVQYLKSWSTAVYEYQSGYWSYLQRYENSSR